MATADFALSKIGSASTVETMHEDMTGKRGRSRRKRDSESTVSGCSRIDLLCKGHSDRLLSGINEMFSSRPFADVIVVVGDQQFEAHRVILASTSDYFRFFNFSSDVYGYYVLLTRFLTGHDCLEKYQWKKIHLAAQCHRALLHANESFLTSKNWFLRSSRLCWKACTADTWLQATSSWQAS